MILALIVLVVQVSAGPGRKPKADDETLASGNGFFNLKYGDKYSPLIISKAGAWHTSYLVPENNYAPLADDLDIFFWVEQDITGEYVEFTHPDRDTYSQCILNKLTDGDWKATCDISDLDTEGTYGPISLVIRSSADNQIIAEDVAFGYFALLGTEPDAGELTISFYSEESSPSSYVVQEEDIVLQFDLTLDVDFYTSDFFLLHIDEAFTFEELDLEWDVDVEGNGLFNETLQNWHAEGSMVYIYGFEGWITDAVTISFRLSGFTAPSVETTGGSYSFTLEAHRYGTNTIYKKYTGTGPSDNVVAGTVTIVSWAPANSGISATTDLYIGLTTWFKLTVKADHDVPVNGTVVFVFSGNSIIAKTHISNADQEIQPTGPAIYTSNSGLTCGAGSATQATCTASSSISAGTDIILYNLITISADLSLTSVIVNDGNDAVIDENIVGLEVALPSTSIAKELDDVTHARIVNNITDDTGVNAINTNDAEYGILIAFKTPAIYTAASDSFTVYLPYLTGTASDSNKLVIASQASVKKVHLDATIDLSADTNLTSVGAVDQPLATGTSSISVPLATSSTVAASRYFYAFIGSKVLGTGKLYLPRVPTQVSQLAEIVLKLKIGSAYYVYASPLYFGPNTLTVDPTVKLACLNPVNAGIPATLSYTPDAYVAPSGYTLKVELDLSGVDFYANTNLAEDEAYPNAPNFKVTADGKLYSSGLSTLPNTVTSITVPLPALNAATNLVLDVSISLVPASGADEIVIYTGSSATVATTINPAPGILVLPDDVEKTVGTTFELIVGLLDGYDDGDSASTDKITVSYILLFPWGYSTTDTDITRPTISNSLFPYSYGYKTLANYVEGTGIAANNSISITVPWFENTTTVYLYGTNSSLETFSNEECERDSIAITTVDAAQLTFVSYSPATAKSYTYSNEEVDVTLTLTAGREILKSSVIAATVDYWLDCTATTYTINGDVGTTAVKDYGTGASIVVKLTGCTLPEIASGGASITGNGFTSVIGTYDGYTFLNWTETGVRTQTVISVSTLVSEKVSGAKLWVFPNVKGAEGVYFGISFTLDPNIPFIPAGSTIEIGGDFDADSDLTDNLWTNFAYTSASISGGGVLTLTNAAKIENKATLMIVKDLAFDLSTITPDTVLVTITYGGVKIIEDVSTTQKYTVQDTPAGKFELEIGVSEASAGFVSVYEFNLTFDAVYTGESFWVHLDATEYNSIVGPAFVFEDLPDIIFLYAADSEDAFLPCFNNHWVTSCYFEGAIDVNDLLTFSIWIKNPSEDGSWGIFVTDNALKYIYEPVYADSDSHPDLAFNSDIENDIDVYFATSDFENSVDHYTHDLYLSAFVDISQATAGSNFWVVFPSPYDFTEYPEDTIKCDLTTNTDDEVVVVLADADCWIRDNTVIFTLEENQAFTAGNWTNFIVYDVLTPELSYVNTAEIYEKDPKEGEHFSENFCILYSTEDEGIVSSSFENLNGAFAEFSSSDLEALIVNDNKRLQVTPGTWSGPYEIKNGGDRFKAESVELTWKSEETFIKLDEDSYIIDFIDNVAEFWIGVPSEVNDELIEEGKYIIEWEIKKEETLPGFGKSYGRPRNTVVEISYELVFNVVINPPVIYVPTSGWGMPINLQFEMVEEREINSLPYESIEIDFIENKTLGLEFRPNPLTLDRDVAAGFVSIKCSKCEVGEKYDFEAIVGGNSASAFKLEKNAYSFISGSRYNVPAVFSIQTSDIKSSEFHIKLQSNQVGLASWTVVSEQSYLEDENITSIEYIYENSFILGAAQNSKDDIEGLKEKHEARLKELDDQYEDFVELTKRKLSLSRSLIYSAQSMVLEEGLNDISHISGLAPKTNYLVYLYFDNFSGQGEVLQNKTVTTLRTPSHATLAFTFASDEPTKEELKSSLKSIFGLPGANYNLDKFGSRRRLADSNTVVVYSDTSSSDSAYTTATDNKVSIEESTGGSVEVGFIADDGEDAEFEGTETWTTDNGIYITLNYSSTIDGSIVCSAEGNGTAALTSDQVYEGVNADGETIFQYSKTILSGENYLVINFTDEDVSPYGTYYVSCIVCNDFPGTPDCSDNVLSTEYEYTGEEDNSDDDDGAEALFVAFAAYILF